MESYRNAHERRSCNAPLFRQSFRPKKKSVDANSERRARKSEGSARSKRRRECFRSPSFRPPPRVGIAPRAEFSRRRYMLYVTLRRGLAGKQQTYIQTLKSLGLHKVRQEVQVANNEAVRGQIDKVKHLVSVETAAQRDARLAVEAKKLAPKEPLVVNH